MSDKELRLGVIGCGGFGLFALQHFTQVPGVKLVGMAGTHRPAAKAAAARFGVNDIVEVEKLCAMDEVDLIYIATPPFLHYDQAMMALNNGKHVICEKPLAMDLNQADEMVAVAKEKRLAMVANLMQRYNPVFAKVRTLVEQKILGEPLHGFFENYACDEGLTEEHWFWDASKSGGIFVEHGVHFFDVFEGWLGEAAGPGKVEAAQRSLRGGDGVEDQVQCAVRYGKEVMVNFYHGFTQPGRMDRQTWRMLFERGDITLSEWVPTTARISGAVDEATTRQLCELFEHSRLDVNVPYGPDDRPARGRFKPLDVYQTIEMTYGLGTNKMHLYGELLRSMIADQKKWIEDPSHQRVITEDNGYQSLIHAVEATALAQVTA
jgi:predicted dehydrogenase